MSNIEKISHWMVLITFLGLVATALAADYFFSKEAILDSFKTSLPILNLEIAPSDLLFIARIERRITWDYHLYFGLAMSLATIVWFTTMIIKKNLKNKLFKVIIFSCIVTLSISGIWMWQRLNFPLSDDAFKTLKVFHHYGYWILIGSIVLHVLNVIRLENKEKTVNYVSNMIKYKNIFIMAVLVATTVNLKAENDLTKWSNDNNYIEGTMYLEGTKGFETLLKEVSNCPYDKCKAADVEKTQYGTKNIEIKKPDYKKAIEFLSISSENGNPLASNKLINFLIKRIDYKSQSPDDYLLKQLKEETGLEFNEYKKIVNKTITEGLKTGKSCMSEYFEGELTYYGVLGNNKDINKSFIHYENASKICPTTNLYKSLAKSKIKKS